MESVHTSQKKTMCFHYKDRSVMFNGLITFFVLYAINSVWLNSVRVFSVKTFVTNICELEARSVDKKNQIMSLFVFFISLPIVAQHVSGNHVPIIRS